MTGVVSHRDSHRHLLTIFFFLFFAVLIFFRVHVASKGVGANLCKVGSKRRRTRQEILDDREEGQLKKEGVEQKLAQIDALTQRCAELEQRAQGNAAADMILRDMISKGQAVMDEQGNVTIPQFEGPQAHQVEQRQPDQQDDSSLM